MAVIGEDPPALDDGGRATTVFFSYSRKDRARAVKIIRVLEKAGFSVWWDAKLEGGSRYVETTEQALSSAEAVVVLWSKTSIASNWVRDEAMVGRDHARLLPLAIDGVMPPLGFRQYQVIDMTNWGGDASSAEALELVRATAALHGQDAPAPPNPALGRRIGFISRRHVIPAILGSVAVFGFGTVAIQGMSGRRRIANNSIAVLPFENDSPDADKDYLSGGLASELRAVLARNPALRVVARSSSESIKRRGLDAVSTARELGVRFLIEGAVRVSGNLVRVSSDLIDGRTGLGRWAQTYDRTVDDLIALQRNLADDISSELSVTAEPVNQEVNVGATSIPAALDEYLRGWKVYRASNSTETDLLALEHFDNAISLDPDFAGAHAARSATLTLLGNTADDTLRADLYYEAAYTAAQDAVRLGPDLDEAYSTLALVLFETQLKIQEAEAPYKRSLELGMGSASIQARFAEYAALTGKHDLALPAARLAIELDPLNPTIYRSAGVVHYAAARYADSIDANRRALALDDSISDVRAWIGYALIQTREHKQAIENCMSEPFSLVRNSCLAIAYHHISDEPQAMKALADLIEEYGDAGMYQQAQVRAQWGQLESAMSALSAAREIGDAGLTYLQMDPMLDPLRARLDFIALRTEMGFS